MKYILILIMTFCLYNCNYGSFTENSQEPVISLLIKDNNTVVNANELIADGFTQYSVEINITTNGEIPEENRKINITTTSGLFINNGKSENTTELVVNNVGTAKVLLKAPLQANKGVLKVVSQKGSYIKEENIEFKPTTIDRMEINIGTLSVKDSSKTTVMTQLFSTKGYPSIGIVVSYELLDNKNGKATNFSFQNITNSDSNGQSSALMILDKISLGDYKIQAKSAGKEQTLDFKVKK